MNGICFDYQSMYSWQPSRLDISTFAEKLGMKCHTFISHSRNTIFNKNITTELDTSSPATVMYQSKPLSEKMENISDDIVKNKLCLVTLKDTYENICDFLINDSIILLAHTKLKEDVGEFKYYKTARSGTSSSSAYIDDMFTSPFYISHHYESHDATAYLSKEIAKEIDKRIVLEMLEISSKMRKEYKLKGTFYYTTVLFYANKSLKIFCDTEIDSTEKYHLSCQEVLDLINKKEEN